MKEGIKNQWVAALRSGEYQQGKHYLKTNDSKYCCLGVLCDLYRKETGKGKWDEHLIYHDVKSFIGSEHDRSSKSLPISVREWAEMGSFSGNFIGDTIDCLTGLNDKGRSFTEIADIIEENWEKL